jgi:lipoprotein-anchoring transpeptidase ErfK/SrfK
LRGATALTAIAALLFAPTLAPADSLSAPQTANAVGPVIAKTLSNLKTASRWAYPQAPAAAHIYPSGRSRVAGRLRFLTGDGQAAPYLELRSATIAGRTWIDVPLPGRPNGVTGWVPAGALGEAHLINEYLRVDRETLRATLYRNGDPIWSAPVGVGRPSLPTPAGHFYVTEKLISVDDPLYGPYALGTSAYAPTLSEWPGGGVVGIHGTDEPGLIPGYPSHGCIRLRNGDIERLWQLIEVGTPIEIT